LNPARQVPFRVLFKTSIDEATADAADASIGELAQIPSGTLGFSLKYVQGTC
jgi:hypothetical protein